MNPIDVDDSDEDDGDEDGTDTDDSGDTGMKRRNIAERFSLRKRDSKRLAGNLVATGDPAIPACTVSTYTYKPAYPGPNDIASSETNPSGKMVAVIQQAKYWAIPIQPAGAAACAAPVNSFVNTTVAKNNGYQVGGQKRRGQKMVNIDHVYEVSLVDEFFQAQVAAGNTCANLNTIWDPNGDPTNTRSTRLNVVFNQIASFQNPDFIGMDAGLNALKGSVCL